MLPLLTAYTLPPPARSPPTPPPLLQRVKDANPGSSVGDVAKVLGAEWKALSAEDKERYEELAQQDKVGGLHDVVWVGGWVLRRRQTSDKTNCRKLF